ncbi:ABC-2 type transporter, partial [Striga asiatica]
GGVPWVLGPLLFTDQPVYFCLTLLVGIQIPGQRIPFFLYLLRRPWSFTLINKAAFPANPSGGYGKHVQCSLPNYWDPVTVVDGSVDESLLSRLEFHGKAHPRFNQRSATFIGLVHLIPSRYTAPIQWFPARPNLMESSFLSPKGLP